MLLAPAFRWRVIVEQVSDVEHDVILETVLRIRDAGEESPTRIADLLQLPEDLIRHLLAWAAADQMKVTHDGQLQTSASRVGWVYRDIATGELWPDPGDEMPPLATRFISGYRAAVQPGYPRATRTSSSACCWIPRRRSRRTQRISSSRGSAARPLTPTAARLS